MVAGQALVVENGQNAALVKVAVLNDLVDGQVLAELGDGQKLGGLSFNHLGGQATDVVPGLAFTAGATLLFPRKQDYKLHPKFVWELYLACYLHGVVDGVVGVVVVVFVHLEDTRGSIKLELDLGGQSALEVDDPQRLFFADGDALDLAGSELDLEGLLEVLLVDDADLLSGISLEVLLHNIFVELLSLGVQELQRNK